MAKSQPQTESRTTRAWVVTWTEPRKAPRSVRQPTLEDAVSYIAEQSLEKYGAVVQEHTVTYTDTWVTVWPEADRGGATPSGVPAAT